MTGRSSGTPPRAKSRERILKALWSLPPLPPDAAGLARARDLLEQMAPGRVPGVRSHPAPAAPVLAEWLVPPDPEAGRRLLYLHGGGYVAGSRNTHRALASRLGQAARANVLLIDYRLAPEHPCPAAIEDARAALGYASQWGPEGPGPPSSLLIAGDSAGGGLAISALVAGRAGGGPEVARAVLFSPWTDLAATGSSVTGNMSKDPIIRPDHIQGWAAMYLAGRSADDPLASPLYADLSGLPPMLIQVGGVEVLRDDGVRLAQRARAQGVPVTLDVRPGMFHVYQAFAGIMPEAAAAIATAGAFLAAP